MNFNAHTHGTEVPAGSRSELIEFPNSLPNTSNHTHLGPQNVPGMLSDFEQHIDETFWPMYPAMAPLDLIPEPHPAINRPSIMDTTMPYPTPMFTDDASTTAYSASVTPSPASGTTLLDFSPFLGHADLAPIGDAPVGQPVASFPPLPNNLDFTFPYGPILPLPPFGPAPGLHGQAVYGNDYAHNHTQGQYWPGQQLSQHGVDAAGAVVPGHTTGMELNASVSAFNAMDPASFSLLPGHLPEPLQGHAIIEEQEAVNTPNEKKRIRLDSDVEPDSPPGESSNQDTAPSKRKRKQDTTKRYPCPYPDCESSAYAVFSLPPSPS